MYNSHPIGIIDSGIGGLTVVKEIQKILPHEDILYFGDSKNCPYGNREHARIAQLTMKMLDFLQEKQVKTVAVACNTISSVIEDCRERYPFPLLSIIEPTVLEIRKRKLKKIGVLATAFTIRTGYYDRMLQSDIQEIQVISQNSPLLAALVDSGNFEHGAINAEIQEQVGKILAKAPDMQQIILACTHYPLMEENFQECYPQIEFINPARMQASCLQGELEKNRLCNSQQREGELTIYTSGDSIPYEKACQMLKIQNLTGIEKVLSF